MKAILLFFCIFFVACQQNDSRKKQSSGEKAIKTEAFSLFSTDNSPYKFSLKPFHIMGASKTYSYLLDQGSDMICTKAFIPNLLRDYLPLNCYSSNSIDVKAKVYPVKGGEPVEMELTINHAYQLNSLEKTDYYLIQYFPSTNNGSAQSTNLPKGEVTFISAYKD